MTESKDAVARVLDAHWSALKARDADVLKENDTWLIDFTSTGFIPNNDDMAKLKIALE